MFGKRFFIAIALVLFVFATNKWMDWDGGKNLLSLHDVEDSYQKIIEAAPALPETKLDQHHAQRFVPLYIIGTVAKFTGVPYRYWFHAVAILCSLLLVLFLCVLLQHLQLSTSAFYVLLALFVLNPYALRYYLLAPGMLSDLIFLLGSALVVFGMVKHRGTFWCLGFALAGMGRQTVVLLMPAFALWIWWKEHKLKRGLLGAFLALAVFAVTHRLSASFSLPSVSDSAILGLFRWFQAGEFTPALFGEHLLRLFVPLAVPFALLSVLAYYRLLGRESLILLLMTLTVVAQPFLSGPVVAGANAGRLSALALIPLVVSLAFAWKRMEDSYRELADDARLFTLAALLFPLSLHHVYTWPPFPPDVRSFVLLQLVGAIFFAAGIFFLLRRASGKSSPQAL